MPIVGCEQSRGFFRIRWILSTVVAILGFASVVPANAEPEAHAQIRAYIRTEMERRQIPGMAVAVLRHGKVEFLEGFGVSNLEHQVPVKPETVFQSGSLAKPFTATTIMILAEEGRLSLDDAITKHFPDSPESWAGITIRHLLSHTSGMADYPPDFDLQRDHTEEELLAIIKTAPLSFAPGEKWDYSNLGFVTLGILVHKVTGQFYGDFLADRVFKPLGMTTARVISEADIVPNRAVGYRLVRGELKNFDWVSPSTNTTADGSLYLSILDLARWDGALYTDTPLAQETLARMWTPATLSDGTTAGYGFGWHTGTTFGHRTMFHGGAWQGFKTFMVRLPADNLTVILLANAWHANEQMLARGLLAVFHSEFALPEAQPILDTERQVTRMIKKLLLQLLVDEGDATLFSPQARKEFFPAHAARIGGLLKKLTVPIAIIHDAELVGRREADGLRHYRYLLTDFGISLLCSVQLTQDDKIAGLEVTVE